MQVTKFVLLFLIILLSACFPWRRVYQYHKDSWIGEPVSELISHPEWGVPTDKIELPDNITAYVYKNCNSGGGSVYTDSNGKVHGNFHGETCCNNYFQVKDGKVLSYTLKGHCYTSDELMPVYKQPKGYHSVLSTISPF
jgi:hypothetical protein